MSRRPKSILAGTLAFALAFGQSVQPTSSDPYYRHVQSKGSNGHVKGDATPPKGSTNTVPGTGSLKVMGPYEVRARPGLRFALLLDAIDPTGAVTWASTGEALPDGLSLAANGILSGTPATVGRFSGLKGTAKDEGDHVGTTRAFTIDVIPLPTVALTPPATISVGQDLSVVPTASDVYGTATWSLAAGTLPAGVSVDPASGRLSGKPEQKGVFEGIRLAVSDADGARGLSDPFALTVTSRLSVGGLLASYRTRVGKALVPIRPFLSGAEGEVSWSVSDLSPSRPSWLSVDPSAGTVTGLPKEVGSHPLILRATDHGTGEPGSGGTIASPTFTIASAGAPTIAVREDSYYRARRLTETVAEIVPVPKDIIGGARWLMVGGLPPGLVLDENTGRISGRVQNATVAATNLKVRAIDLFDGAVATSNPFTIRTAGAIQVPAPSPRQLEKDWPAQIPGGQVTGVLGEPTWSVAPALPAGLAIDKATGAISGTPTSVSGEASYVLTVKDSSDGTSEESAPFRLSVVPFTEFKVLPFAEASHKAESSLRIVTELQGRRGEVAYGISGPVPDWASFDEGTGILSGTPPLPGSFGPLTITARDALTGSASSAILSIRVLPARPIAISMADGSVTQGIHSELRPTISDAVGTPSVSLRSGRLPPGLGLTEAGSIVGKAKVSGTFADIVLAAGDAVATAESAPFSIKVLPGLAANGEPIAATMPATIGGSEDDYLDETPRSTGLQGPLRWSLVSGSLPAWASLDQATGRIRGQPDGATVADNLVLQVLDGDGNGARTEVFQIAVTQSRVLRAFVSGDRHEGATGEEFSLVPSVRNAAQGQSWTISGGPLPDGLTLDNATGAIKGKPSVAMVAQNLVLRVTDGSGATAATDPFTIAVSRGRLLLRLLQTEYEVELGQELLTAVPVAMNVDAAISWSVSSANLPGWISLAPDNGRLRGNPAALGTFEGIVVRGDTATATGFVGPIKVTVVRPDLGAEVGSALRQAKVGSPVSISPTATGVVGTQSWTIEGRLPDGLELAQATGRVSGRPSAPGRSGPLILVLRDSFDGRTARSEPFEMEVVLRPTALDIAGPGDMEAKVGERMVVPAPSASNAEGAVAWSPAGELPSWLALDASGSLSGVPPRAGEIAGLALKGIDADGVSGTTPPFSIRISGNVKVSGLPAGYQAEAETAMSTGAPRVENAEGAVVFSIESGALPDGLEISPATGVISGSPAHAGNAANLVIAATDARGDVGRSAPFSITVSGILVSNVRASYATVVGQPLAMPAPVATGTQGETTWSVASGTLPDWASLAQGTGIVSGTPRRIGTSAGISLKATDARGKSGRSAVFALRATSALSLGAFGTTHVLPVGEQAAIANPQALNPFGNVSWSLEGDLPNGLAFSDATGAISGTPTTKGTYTGLVIKAADESGDVVATPAFSISVAPNLKVAGLETSYAARVRSPFTTPVPTALNAEGSVTWSIAGTLPAWARFDEANGTVSGTPTVGGIVANLVITAKDATGAEAPSRPITISVSSGPSVGGVATGYPVRIGMPLRIEPTASDAQGAIAWRLAQGTLPSWLGQDGATGLLTGTPDAVGSFPGIVLRATDASGLEGLSLAFGITVSPAMAVADVPDIAVGKVGVEISVRPRATNPVGAVRWTLAGTLPGWARFDPATGAVTGKPTSSGRHGPLTLTATDAEGAKAPASFSFEIAKNLVVTTPKPFYEAKGGVASSTDAPRADYAAGKVAWTLASGILPTWASLDRDTGVLTLSPSAPGESGALVLRATDSEGTTGDGTPFTLAAVSAFDVGVASVRKARETVASELPPHLVSGAEGAVTWSVLGELPAWARLDGASGRIAVTPDRAGTYPGLRLRATDTRGRQGYGNAFAIVVDPAMRVADLPAVTRVRSGAPLTIPARAEDAQGAVTWTASGLPDWARVDPSSGTIRGTAGAKGTVDGIVLTATDGQGFEARSKAFSISVVDGIAVTGLSPSYDGRQDRPLGAIEPRAFPPAASQEWTATGLPAGLAVDPATGAITGLPSASGTYQPVVTVRDRSDGAEASASTRITLARPLAVTGMPARMVARVGSDYAGALPGVVGQRGTLTWSGLGTFPGWAGVDPATGTVRGKPTAMSSSPGLQLQAEDGTDHVRAPSDIFQLDALMPVGISGLPTSLIARFGFPFSAARPSLANAVEPVTWAFASNASPPAWLQIDPATGVISGTPDSVDPVAPLAVTASDATKASDTSARILVSVYSQPEVAVTPQAFVNRVGDSVSIAPTPKGIVGNASWSLVATRGALPAGLSIDEATGRVASTLAGPTGAVATEFVVRLTDTADGAHVDSEKFSILTKPRLALTNLLSAYRSRVNTFLTTGDPGVVGNQQALTYTLSQTPAGFTFDGTSGVLSGSPNALASHPSLTLTVKDAYDGRTASATFSLDVLGAMTAGGVADLYLRSGTNSGTASFSPTTTNALAPDRLAWEGSGTLPDGVSINPASGRLTGIVGTYAAATQFPFLSLLATDRDGSQAQTGTYKLTALPALGLAPIDKAATEEVAFSYQVPVTGLQGTSGNTWTISGQPNNVTIDATGKITGRPRAPFTGQPYAVSVTVRDALDGASITSGFVMTVTPAPSLTVAAGATRLTLPQQFMPDASGACQTVTVYNAGSVPAASLSYQTDNTKDFATTCAPTTGASTPACGSSLDSKKTCVFGIALASATAGDKTGKLTVAATGAETRSLDLTGNVKAAFTSFTFTTCGATGPTGPTADMCANTASYAAESWTKDASKFSVSGGNQVWTVPVTGTYRLVANGAKGGSSNTLQGGNGATATSRVSLRAGDQVTVTVGQKGTNGTASRGMGGGGGGTFAAVRDASNIYLFNPLVVGGGGGGGGDRTASSTGDANLTQDGKTPSAAACRSPGFGAGGTGGMGGQGNYAGGGGGFDGPGRDSCTPSGSTGYAAGGKGGLSNGFQGGGMQGGATGQAGGFGGGGAAFSPGSGGGGGGGYSGGAGGGSVAMSGGAGASFGGGGGSYYTGSGSGASVNASSDQGSLTVTLE